MEQLAFGSLLVMYGDISALFYCAISNVELIAGQKMDGDIRYFAKSIAGRYW
ncbi:hypothetical protein [Snodgrassella gandavensis]|uniref:hypothetical protein n=1 Tax=Snodgrassella gandavensis TaxID=2946698 RepID=UPI001EF4A94A|nr:hypothetical protein [Snodgrassella gandavensis]